MRCSMIDLNTLTLLHPVQVISDPNEPKNNPKMDPWGNVLIIYTHETQALRGWLPKRYALASFQGSKPNMPPKTNIK